MRRQFLSLFLTLLILISVGGVVSIVGAASHATHGQITKLDSKPTVAYLSRIHVPVFIIMRTVPIGRRKLAMDMERVLTTRAMQSPRDIDHASLATLQAVIRSEIGNVCRFKK